MENTFGDSGMGEEKFQKFLHTCWSAQEDLGLEFEVEWNYAKPGMPSGRVLELDSEACIINLPAYFEGAKANEISLKL